MAKAIATLTWSAALETYAWSDEPSGVALSPVPDSPAWFAWLAEVPSFAFRGQAGSFTARQERRERGERYWYAYLRTGQQVRKKYLGKTADLTLARLEQVTRMLEAERAKGAPPDPARPARQEPRERPDARLGDPFTPLLATQLHVPRPPARLVLRPRLIARLSQGLAQPLILLSAPAGFGKTTLLAEWLARCRLPVAWLSLDPQDNDPLRFLTAVLAALQTCDPTLGASVRALLSSPRGLSLPAVFALLINDIATRDGGDLVLVLDDYHHLGEEAIHRALGLLVDHCPPNLHLVLATRADPPLALARLRAGGKVCELRAADLQFDLAEARAFLHTALGRDLEATTLESILTRTEGWAAGLQLTVLSLQGRRSEDQVRTFLANSLASQRSLVDYLVAEVLAQQPEAVQAFLLHTCILEPLCASLCAAVTGADSPAESAAMLASLERANLFLFPLDERGEWYRYHPLWASVLRVRLFQQDDGSSVAALYGRASRWYEQHDLPAEAIEAALAADEDERALQLIEQHFLPVRRKYALLRRWIERLSPDLWAAHPLACLAYAWALFLSGALDAATLPLQQAEQLFRQQANPVGLGMVQALYAVAAALRGEGRAAIAAGTAALALLPAGDRFLRDLCRSVVGSGYWLVGELTAAWQLLVQMRVQHERADDVDGALGDSIVLGNILALQGQLHEAEAYYQRVRDEAGVRRGHAIEAMIRLGQLWYEWNALEEADAELAHAIAEAEQVADEALLARGVLSLAYAVQARIRQARGEHEQASALFRQAVTLAELNRHGRLLAQIQAFQLRWWLAQGHQEAVARWRAGAPVGGDAAPNYEEEPGALALARVLVASGEAGAALRLLERYRAHAHDQGRLGSELEMLVLCALAEARRGKTEPAVQHLHHALSLAEPVGYIRLFLDEGPPLLPLLRVALARGLGQPCAHYVQQLLTLLEDEHPDPTGAAHPDQEAGHLTPAVRRISARELAVLRLLAEGLTTRQMAARLVVSPNTIKTQLASLYRKLDVRTREEALAQASRLHLLETVPLLGNR